MNKNTICPRCNDVFGSDGVRLDPQPSMIGPTDIKICAECAKPKFKPKGYRPIPHHTGPRLTTHALRMPYKD